MVSFDNFKDWFKIGSSALAIALASEVYAAGPSKPKPTSTAQITLKIGVPEFDALVNNYSGNPDDVSEIRLHDAKEKDPDSGYVVYMGNKNNLLGIFDNKKRVFAPVRASPTKVPKGISSGKPAAAKQAKKPAATPTPAYEPLDLNSGQTLGPSPTKDDFSLEGIVSPTATPTPVQTSTPTPQPTKKPNFLSRIPIPIAVSGRGNISPYQQQVSGRLWDGSGWRDVYTGARLNVRELGLRTEDLTKYLNGLFLVDGNIGRASIKGLENGTHNGGEVIGRMLAEFGYNNGKAAIGPAGGFSRHRFVFPGGTFTQTRSGAGLELRVGAAAKDGSLSGGVRGRWLNYSAAAVHNDGFASRDQDILVAGFLDVPRIGDWSVYAEGGLRNVSQRGDSGQGDTSQGVGYLFTEIGKDVRGFPVYGVLGLSKVVFQPADVNAFELRAGVGAGFSTKIGYKK